MIFNFKLLVLTSAGVILTWACAGCSRGDAADNGPLPPPPAAGQKAVDPASNPLNFVKHRNGQKTYVPPSDLSKVLPGPGQSPSGK